MTSDEQFRLTKLEAWREQFEPAQQARNLDVEQRLRRLERALYGCTGALAVLQFVLKLWH